MENSLQYCGTTEDYCGAGCQSNCTLNDVSCGPEKPCANGYCCSQWGVSQDFPKAPNLLIKQIVITKISSFMMQINVHCKYLPYCSTAGQPKITAEKDVKAATVILI